MKMPTLTDRLAARERPVGRAVMRQRWSDLLFLHWPVPAETIQARLPRGLYADTFNGTAWLGVVPFFMDRIRPVLLPPLPGVSWFLELNVRTYVHDENGVPGVWFHSLECNQPLAVVTAQRFFHLPYRHAVMSADRQGDHIHYFSRREYADTYGAGYRYDRCRVGVPAEPGSLEFFLVERYHLFSANPDGGLFRGTVHHEPYRIAQTHCSEWSSEPIRLDGFQVPEGLPVSILAAEPVDVSVYPLRRWSR